MTKEEAHTLLEVMAINITGELAGSGHIITDQTKLLAKQLEAIDMAIDALSAKDIMGEWEEKIIEGDSVWTRHRYYCSVCGGWNTYGKSDYCPDCGAKMKGDGDE